MSVGPKVLVDRELLVQARAHMDPTDRRKLLTSAEGLLNQAEVFEPGRDPTTAADGAAEDRSVEGPAAACERISDKVPT